jgi:UDP-N-acetylglucosamine 2-epimerase
VKVTTILGARPQFIKYAPLAKELSKVAANVLIHTGQHYDWNMSDVFFRGLDLPQPDYNLGIGSGSHGEQSGEMLKCIEKVLLTEEPDCVLVFGDTNSTLAGALAAAKLHIPVGHIEAGLRSFNRRMPEEINRVVTDHLSSMLFCPTETSVINLEREGIREHVYLVGDIMYDALLSNAKLAVKRSTILESLGLRPKSYFLATVHRAENTEDFSRLRSIIKAFAQLAKVSPVIWPVHPRTRKILGNCGLSQLGRDCVLLEPLSYHDMLCLEKEATIILTDSGGIQKEAYWLGVPCVTLRDETEWVETLEAGWNVLAGTDPDRIFASATMELPSGVRSQDSFGDGHAARKIVEALLHSYSPKARGSLAGVSLA